VTLSDVPHSDSIELTTPCPVYIRVFGRDGHDREVAFKVPIPVEWFWAHLYRGWW
jgi:hypothetical protein